MKQIFILILVIAPIGAFAAEPSTSCPYHYTAVYEEYMTIAEDLCPARYTSVGTADSCLVSSPSDSCIMYAPANTEYSDDVGAYKFIVDCPME